MKLAREETKIKVTGRSLYRIINLKFEGRNRNRSRNRGQKIWDPEPEPEPEPRQNGTVPQHCWQLNYIPGLTTNLCTKSLLVMCAVKLELILDL
jgi:hypothetical protein